MHCGGECSPRFVLWGERAHSPTLFPHVVPPVPLNARIPRSNARTFPTNAIPHAFPRSFRIPPVTRVQRENERGGICTRMGNAFPPFPKRTHSPFKRTNGTGGMFPPACFPVRSFTHALRSFNGKMNGGEFVCVRVPPNAKRGGTFPPAMHSVCALCVIHIFGIPNVRFPMRYNVVVPRIPNKI
jgi:hypothetical protein